MDGVRGKEGGRDGFFSVGVGINLVTDSYPSQMGFLHAKLKLVTGS